MGISVNRKHSGVHVPSHLKQYVVEQHYENYTPVDHAIWRYVMRQNSRFLEKRAHSSYLNGLKESGIGLESIPDIEYMNKCLSRIGWGAVTISGFIPGTAFMEFQAHRILPIAADIRTLEHIAYTPAPDIIHESAGHAPILLDEKYRSFIQLIGEIGSKAFSTKQDHDVYEAIRLLSIVKEDPTSTPEQIKEAEENLERALQAVREISEAIMVNRFYWWTVEYGLIGELDHPLIYGAGLLSSVGESMSCLKDDVKKIPFNLEDCINTDYDITKPQPQLFVCKNFDELIEATKELAKRMAFSVGGTFALQKALQSANTATVVYSSGLQVSGTLTELEYDASGEAIYLKTSGPTAVAYNNKELPGHGKDYHHEGFGSPIGLLRGTQVPLEHFTDEQLNDVGLFIGSDVKLEFTSGVTVQGTVKSIHREEENIVLISFDNCTVTYGNKTLFRSEWGTYDMAVGEKVVSAFPGAADKERFGEGIHKRSKVEAKRPALSQEEQKRHHLYRLVRDLRENLTFKKREGHVEHVENVLTYVHQQLDLHFPQDWLLRLEILEIMTAQQIMPEGQAKIRAQLKQLMNSNYEIKQLIENGLALLD